MDNSITMNTIAHHSEDKGSTWEEISMTPVKLDDWIGTLPINVQHILRAKLKTAQGMYETLTAEEITSLIGPNAYAAEWSKYEQS